MLTRLYVEVSGMKSSEQGGIVVAVLQRLEIGSTI